MDGMQGMIEREGSECVMHPQCAKHGLKEIDWKPIVTCTVLVPRSEPVQSRLLHRLAEHKLEHCLQQ